MKFPKAKRILKRADFQNLSKHGRRSSGKFLHINTLPSSSARLGLTVTRKFGKSTIRNRFKRLVREAFRTTELPPLQINIFPQKEAQLATLEQIREELKNLTK